MTENSIIKIDCKYYLPCGRCDKTNEMCSQLDGIVLSIKPNGATTTKPNEYSVHPSFYIPVDNGGVLQYEKRERILIIVIISEYINSPIGGSKL